MENSTSCGADLYYTTNIDTIKHIVHNAHPHQYNVYRGYVHLGYEPLQKDIDKGQCIATKVPPHYLFSQQDGQLAFETITDDSQLPDPTTERKTDLILWSKMLSLLGGDYYQLAHIDKEIYERTKE
eukprot:TRINITY_DN3821_c0_g1_i1.p1 TRINITY_DN3821_c0_g1~~TRINITY_DN3821_c0_g1_i1.p1  ORF type:complete len:126 (+),score=11.19 TRINITY_DN3821_c0_g1_i1:145-522(+)